MKEIQIFSPDGKTRTFPLSTQRVTLGRSGTAELCYPDDAGLSRHHLAFESSGDQWSVRDLGSKNGTLVNGVRIGVATDLHPGDRITAGHLVLVFDSNTQQPARRPKPVVFLEDDDSQPDISATVVTNLAASLEEDSTASGHRGVRVSALIKAGNELASQRPLPELFQVILDLSMQAVAADRGVLMTLENEDLVVRATRGEGFRISATVRDKVIREKTSVLVRDTSMDAAFRERRSIVEQNVRTLMAVPLQAAENVLGLIYIDSPSRLREFSRDDLSLLTVMANIAANRVEHVRLAEIEQARKLMARDLEQAAEIQKRALPENPPRMETLDVAGYNAACRTVGGDYFDFFTYPEDRVALVLGDVSGKGMPASLLMMGLQARVQMLIDEPKDLGAIVTRINRVTASSCPDNRFITFFASKLDGRTGQLAYANAGHNPPIVVRRNGSFQTLPGGGPVLGILKSFDYSEMHAHLGPGDILVIYSDGVTEAASPNDDEFDVEQLAATVAAHRDQPSTEIVRAVNQAIVKWTQGAPPADDITLIVARRLEGGSN